MKRPYLNELQRYVIRIHPNTLWAQGLLLGIARKKLCRGISTSRGLGYIERLLNKIVKIIRYGERINNI